MANQYKNKVVYNGTTLIDLSDTTAVQSDVASGKYFYLATGEKVEGTNSGGGGDEPVTPTETLLGTTPYTLLEDADIKLVGDGSYTYSVSAIDAEFADRKNVTLSNATLTDEGTYFELADTGASVWYASTANMYFDGLVSGTSYTITVDSLGDGTTCTGGYWVIRDATGDNTYGAIEPLTGSNTLTFTATGTSINVLMAPADSTNFDSGIKVARWRNMTITHAESASGTDETLLGELKAGTQITSSPSVQVYAIIESSGTLRGKTCVCLGDSVTGLMDPPNDYPSVLASNTGMTVINGGFEGCRMSDTHPSATYAAFSAVKLADAIATGTWTTQDANISGFESGSYAPAHLTALKAVNWSNVDYITVEFGGNDAGDQYVYINNASNPTDTTTYVGAARYVYNRIHAAYPNIKIMFFVPMYRYWISEGKDSDEMTFTLGGNTYHYYDWGDALIASPPASGVPVIDMYRTLGINASNRTTYLLTSDQTHPSVEGCALIAQKFQTELTNHFLPSGGSATLITKTITANGTYSASDDSADGYSEVTVNVAGGGSGYIRTVVVPEQTVTPIYHSDGNINGYFAQLNNVTEMFEQWSEYIVTFNGTEYYFTTVLMWGVDYLFGEQSYLWSGTSGTNYPYPFCVISESINNSYIYTASADSVTVKIEKLELTGSGGGGGSSTLITKTITANGTYSASDDSADGYSEVTVNVSLPVTWETKSDQDITITSDGTYNYAIWRYTEPLQANETYRITWGKNETQYVCQTVAAPTGAYDGYFLGNASIVNAGENTGEPFVLYRNSNTRMVVTTTQSTGSWHVKVEKQVPLSSATLTTKTITLNGTYDAEDDSADGYSSVTVNVTPNLQSKSATPTTSSQTISPDSGYDGLSSVTVGAIPSQYIVPTGNKAITENGNNIDVAQYSTVSVNISGSSMNVQTQQSTTRRNNTALGSITSLTCSKAGTYDVYWSCARSSTSGTWGSQLYINGTAYGTENTTFSNHVQNNHLTGVTIPANATVAVYGRSRSGYYIYVSQLTIQQTA